MHRFFVTKLELSAVLAAVALCGSIATCQAAGHTRAAAGSCTNDAGG